MSGVLEEFVFAGVLIISPQQSLATQAHSLGFYISSNETLDKYSDLRGSGALAVTLLLQLILIH